MLSNETPADNEHHATGLHGSVPACYSVWMKTLHRPDLFGWSRFDEARDVDFNSMLWARSGGNVAIDPLPLTPHDRAHVERLGGIAWIVVTNGDHLRDTEAIAAWSGARIAGPAGERETLPIRCDRWLAGGDELVPGLVAIALEGSKTPGELALLLEGTTLLTGDLLRAHRADSLHLLPPEKLVDAEAARDAVRGLLAFTEVRAILVGDGWPLFRDGHSRLRELVDSWAPGAR